MEKYIEVMKYTSASEYDEPLAKQHTAVTLLSLSKHLEDEKFRRQLAVSISRLLKYKYDKLDETRKKLSGEVDKQWTHIITEWRGQLQLLSDKKSTDQSRALADSNIYDSINNRYPEFFTDKMNILRTTTLMNSIKRQIWGESIVSTDSTPQFFVKQGRTSIGRTASVVDFTEDEQGYSVNDMLFKWAKKRVLGLQKTVLTALLKLRGRETQLDEVARMIYTFAGNWKYPTQTFTNIILMGNAGTGKTRLANCIGALLAASGFVFTDNVIEKHKHDFIGQFIGQSAPLTAATLSSSLESVLFIDEAYTLATCDKYYAGNVDDDERKCREWNSYSEESIGTLLTFLNDNKGRIVVILGGYEDAINKSLLQINEGVERRFPYKWVLDDYPGDVLYEITAIMLKENFGLSLNHITTELAQSFLKQALGSSKTRKGGGTEMLFLNQAGDAENLAAYMARWYGERKTWWTNFGYFDTPAQMDLCDMQILINKYLIQAFSVYTRAWPECRKGVDEQHREMATENSRKRRRTQ